MQKDLGKQLPFEVTFSDYNLPLEELEDTISHLKTWMQPEYVDTNFTTGNNHKSYNFL